MQRKEQSVTGVDFLALGACACAIFFGVIAWYYRMENEQIKANKPSAEVIQTIRCN